MVQGGNNYSKKMVFTCTACALIFKTVEEQKKHHTVPLHKHNLIRKTKGLSPDTEESFLISLKENDKKKGSFFCDTCKMYFKGKNSFQNHFKKKRSKCLKPLIENENKTVEEDIKIEQNQCLFCSYKEDCLKIRIMHMQKKHGLFISEKDNLVDYQGLLDFFRKWISEYKQCLYCADLCFFDSVRSVQKHMNKLGHTNIRYEDKRIFSLISKFYCFKKTENKGVLSDEYETTDCSDNEISEMSLTDDLCLSLPSGTVISCRPFKKKDFSVYKTPFVKEGTKHIIKKTRSQKRDKRIGKNLISRRELSISIKRNKKKFFKCQIF